MQRFIDTISETLGRYLPSVIGAALILLVGFIVASLLRAGFTRLLNRIGVDARLKEKTGSDPRLTPLLASILFYLVVLYAAVIALGVLGIEGVLDPAKAMLAKTLDIVPNAVAALLIGLIGYIVARIVSGAVRIALASTLDRIAPKAGLGEDFKPSGLLSTFVFVLVLVPVLISALDALKIEAISQPAVRMLDELMAAVPNVIGALIILGVAYVAGRFVRGILVNILKNVGADNFAEKTGGARLFGQQGFSVAIGNLALFFILLAASLSAVETLNLQQLSSVLRNLLVFSGEVAVGLLVIAVGSWLANIAYTRLNKDGKSSTLASIARIIILGFVLALGLRAMGIGDEIVNLAFGLTLGAIAVAVALSFGLGGREAAGRQMEHWLGKWRTGNDR